MLASQLTTEYDSAKYRQLANAIETIESHRTTLGDEIVEIAVSLFSEQIDLLRRQEETAKLQRKFVSVLFVDIYKSVPLVEQLGDDRAFLFIDDILSRFEHIVEKYGGRPIKRTGDGIMAVFGMPYVGEDDAERAVLSGLEILDAANHNQQQWKTKFGLEQFGIRVGIDTGPAIVGGGEEAKKDVIGMTASVASRMESAAPVGGLLITNSTYKQIYGLFHVKKQPLLPVPGMDEPLQTFLVDAPLPRTFRMHRHGIIGLKTPMIGRNNEFRHLTRKYQETVQQQKANIMTVLGEPGIGKSRLLDEFDDWMAGQNDPCHCFRGRGFSTQRGTPYWIIRMLIAGFCRIQDSDDADIVTHKLETRLSSYFEEDSIKKIYIIGSLLGYSLDGLPNWIADLDDSQKFRDQALHYLQQLFGNILDEGLATILVEDLHWADAPSIDFLNLLEDVFRDRALFIVYSARPEIMERFPDWIDKQERDLGQDSTIKLSSLKDPDSRGLISAILSKVNGLPFSLIQSISDRAEGNPLYIEESIKMLFEDGVILRAGNGKAWTINPEKLRGHRVPTTLTAVMQSRLDRLPSAEKGLLQRAAIIGRTFWVGALASTGDGYKDIGVLLGNLVQHDLIFEKEISTFIGQAEYSFRHVLLRDVAYETILIWDRTEHHLQAANWLQRMTGQTGREDEFATVIAEHYALGEETIQAAFWYFRAGRRAKNQGVPEEACDFFERALELLPDEPTEKRTAVLLEKERVLERLGHFEAQLYVLQAIIDFALARNDSSQLALAYSHLGFCYRNCGRSQEEIDAYKRSITAARRSNNRALEAHSSALLAHCLQRHGEIKEASRLAEEAHQIASTLDDETYKAKALTNIGGFYSESGDIAKAMELFTELVTFCAQLELSYGQAVNLSNLGYNYILLGLPELAIPHLNQSISIIESIGAHHLETYCQINMGLANWRLGDYEQAELLLTDSLKQFAELNDIFGQGSGSLYLGLTYEQTGNCDAAKKSFQLAKDHFEKLNFPGYAIDVMAGLARCYLKRGDRTMARRYADKVWYYLSSNGAQGVEFPTLAYQTCYQTYLALDEEMLSASAKLAGMKDLEERAEKISEPIWRKAFLKNISEHQVFLGENLETSSS